MQRESFIFYESFGDAIDDLPDAEQLQLYRAIRKFSTTGEELELTGIAKSFWKLMKPQLEANNKRFSDGNKGGRPQKTTGFDDEKPLVNNSKTSGFDDEKPNKNVNENENENEKENDSLSLGACEEFSETNFSANSVISHQFSDFWSQYPKRVGENLARNAWFELSTAERVSCLERLPKAREYLLLRGKTYIPMPDKFLREQRWNEDFDALIAEHRARGSPKQFTTESTGANLVRFGNALDVADEDWSEEERERDEFLASRSNA